MSDLENYRRKRLTDIENRDADKQGGSAGPDARKNELPKMQKPTTFSQVRKENK